MSLQRMLLLKAQSVTQTHCHHVLSGSHLLWMSEPVATWQHCSSRRLKPATLRLQVLRYNYLRAIQLLLIRLVLCWLPKPRIDVMKMFCLQLGTHFCTYKLTPSIIEYSFQYVRRILLFEFNSKTFQVRQQVPCQQKWHQKFRFDNPDKQITCIILYFAVQYDFPHIKIIFVGVHLEDNHF